MAKRKKKPKPLETDPIGDLSAKLFDYTGVVDFGRSLYPDQVDTNEAAESFQQQQNELYQKPEP